MDAQPIPSIVIDREQLQECSEGDRAFEQEILHLFVNDTQQHLGSLKIAIATQNFELARRAAHHIKGASSHVGALAMFAIASAVEVRAQQQITPLSTHLLSQLETAYQDVIHQTELWDRESTALR